MNRKIIVFLCLIVYGIIISEVRWLGILVAIAFTLVITSNIEEFEDETNKEDENV